MKDYLICVTKIVDKFIAVRARTPNTLVNYTPVTILTSTEFFLPSQNSILWSLAPNPI